MSLEIEEYDSAFSQSFLLIEVNSSYVTLFPFGNNGKYSKVSSYKEIEIKMFN